MIVNTVYKSSADSVQTASRTNSTAASADTPSFESQLSSVLAESLQKLGVGSGAVNISIRNDSASTRQIVVTYAVDEASASDPSATTAGTTSTATPATATATASTSTAAASTTGMPALAVTPMGTTPFNIDLTYVGPTPTVQVEDTPWAPHSGPRDTRDQLPVGGGQVTASGAPLIKDNATGAGNQFGYTGPATKNPYFSTPSNPLREGYVLGFGNWFESPLIIGGMNGPQAAAKAQFATEEGANEALRIVKQFAPQATLVKSVWQSGPFSIDTPMYEVELSEGRRLNAGGVLGAYYTHGYGVPASADEKIRQAIQLA